VDKLVPFIRGIGDWAAANPGLLRGIAGVVGGMIAMRTAVFGLKFLGNFFILTPFNAATKAVELLSGRFTLFRALVLGGTSRLSLLFQIFGVSAKWADRLTLGLGKVGQAALWLGRALFMNPIGLAITGIAVGAILIYRYWTPIKQFFSTLSQCGAAAPTS
jgi:phage-related tail protein